MIAPQSRSCASRRNFTVASSPADSWSAVVVVMDSALASEARKQAVLTKLQEITVRTSPTIAPSKAQMGIFVGLVPSIQTARR